MDMVSILLPQGTEAVNHAETVVVPVLALPSRHPLGVHQELRAGVATLDSPAESKRFFEEKFKPA